MVVRGENCRAVCLAQQASGQIKLQGQTMGLYPDLTQASNTGHSPPCSAFIFSLTKDSEVALTINMTVLYYVACGKPFISAG